jgi:hypothetical protein
VLCELQRLANPAGHSQWVEFLFERLARPSAVEHGLQVPSDAQNLFNGHSIFLTVTQPNSSFCSAIQLVRVGSGQHLPSIALPLASSLHPHWHIISQQSPLYWAMAYPDQPIKPKTLKDNKNLRINSPPFWIH